ncbi:hypothetical protein DXG01_012700, partial [Tephrocybe rancida]
MAESSLLPLDWVTVLSRKHFDTRLLDALRSSTICDFSDNVVRTGTFLNITAPTAAQPRVSWLCKYNVPVWYRWGPEQASDPSYEHFAPLPWQMQNAVDALAGLTQAARVLAVDSSVVDPDVVDQSVVKLDDRPPDYIAFFAARDVRNAKRLLTERPGDRQARLDRERKPPVASAKVFEWICHHLTGEWHREQVRKAERKETLDEYSVAQKRYDSFFNEWDCCHEWGPGESNIDEFNEFYGAPLLYDVEEPIDPTNPPEPPHVKNPLPRVLTPPPQPEQTLDSERLD